MTGERHSTPPISAGVDPEVPFISVILPVRDEEHTISAVITSLLRQDYPGDRLEIIVCDGYSTDNTYEIVQKIVEREKRVRLLRNEGRCSSAGRNLGYHNAGGDIILYVDGHCVIPDDSLLASVAELIRTTGAGCLCRAQPLVPDEKSGLWASAIATVRASRFGHSRSSYIFSNHEGFISPISVGAVYTREVFETIGEFDESFDACEDVEFNLRVEGAGFKSYISPRLKVLYHARRGWAGLYKQMKRYGRGRFKLIKKHPGAFESQILLPPAVVLGSLFALLAFVFLPPLRWPLLTAVVAIYAGLLLLLLPGSERFGRRGWPLYPLVFFTIFLGLGIGFGQAAIMNSFSDALHIGPDRKQSPGKSR